MIIRILPLRRTENIIFQKCFKNGNTILFLKALKCFVVIHSLQTIYNTEKNIASRERKYTKEKSHLWGSL